MKKRKDFMDIFMLENQRVFSDAEIGDFLKG